MPPDPPQSRLTQRQEARTQTAQQIQAGTEFASAEELLRADRAQTRPPPQIETRLQQSIAQEPPPPRPWWKRWLGR